MARLKSYAVLVGKTITTLLLSDKDAARRLPAIEAAEKILAGQDRESATPAAPPVPDRVPEGGAVVITPGGATTAVEATPAPPTSPPAAPEAPAAAADATPAADVTAATAGEASADDPDALTPEQIEAQLEAEAAGTQAKAATPPANKARGSRSKA